MGIEQDLAAIERRRRLAEVMMQQGAEDIPMQTAGGMVVPVSPLQGISKIANMLSGAYIGNKADREGAAIKQARMDALGNIDFNSPDAASELAKAGMVEEAVKMRMEEAKLRAKAEGKGADPFYQFLPGEKGYLVGNARTGAVTQAMLDGQPVLKASDSPMLKAQLKAAEEGQKGVKMTDETGHEYYAPQAAVNPQDFTNLIGGLIKVESGGNPNAVSPVGARGLTQIMPETARSPGHGVTPMKDQSVDEQIRFGSDYLRAMIKHFGGDVKKGLAAYNGGIGNANIPETRQYADKVLSSMGIAKGQSPAEAAAAKAEAELPIKIAEDQAKAEISKNKEIETDTGKKAAEAQIQAKIDLPQAKANADMTKTLIDEISNHPGLSGYVGLPSPLKYLPGTNEQGFKAKLDQLKGKQFLEAFQSLKGAGQITEVEGTKATNAIAALNEAQKEDDFKKELSKLKEVIDSANQRLSQKAGETPQPSQDNKQERLKALRAKHGL